MLSVIITALIDLTLLLQIIAELVDREVFLLKLDALYIIRVIV